MADPKDPPVPNEVQLQILPKGRRQGPPSWGCVDDVIQPGDVAFLLCSLLERRRYSCYSSLEQSPDPDLEALCNAGNPSARNPDVSE